MMSQAPTSTYADHAITSGVIPTGSFSSYATSHPTGTRTTIRVRFTTAPRAHKIKRDDDGATYMAIEGDQIVTVDNEDDATEFTITEEGYLTAEDYYVGIPKGSSDLSTFYLYTNDTMDQAVLQTWSITDDGLTFTNDAFQNGTSDFYVNNGTLVAATQGTPSGDFWQYVVASIVGASGSNGTLPSPSDLNGTFPDNGTLPDFPDNSTFPPSFNGTDGFNGTFPPMFNGSFPPMFNGSFPPFNGSYNGTFGPPTNSTPEWSEWNSTDSESMWNKTDINAKAFDAAYVINSLSLTDFCSTYLGYTTPTTVVYAEATTYEYQGVTETDTVDITITGSATATITYGEYSSGIVNTTTTVPTTITITSADSNWERLRRRQDSAAPIQTPAALTTFDDSALSQACSWKAQPVSVTSTIESTTTITVTITTTDYAAATSTDYETDTSTSTVPATTVPETTQVLTSVSTSTINECEPTSPSQLIKNPSFECGNAGWDVGYTGSELWSMC